MDCNKEEAIRAKGLAEKKMQNKDFVGARKIALKAQALYPDLENINQMLTVCEVHISAERKVFVSEMDWYGILQISQSADEASLKKQYRKLALLLHPDKNKFTGAEAAFKLVGEAQRVLSDSAKRSVYDMRYKATQTSTVSKPPQQQQTKNANSKKQPGVNINFMKTGSTQFTKMNIQQQQQQQQSRSVYANGKATFWTACPSCSIRYQYYAEVLNRSLICQNCNKPFVACDLSAQAQGMRSGGSWSQFAVPQQNGVPTQGFWNQSAVPQQNGVPTQSFHNMNSQNNPQSKPSSMGFQGPGHGTSASEPIPKPGGTSVGGEESKPKRQEDMEVDREEAKKSKRKSKTDEVKPKTSRKRSKNLEAESSESSKNLEADSSESSDNLEADLSEISLGSSTDTDEDEIFEAAACGHPAGQNVGGHYPRRSVRKKQDVTYKENLSDDDLVSPQKRSDGSGSSNVTIEQNETSLNKGGSKPTVTGAVLKKEKEVKKQNSSAPMKESLPNGNDKVEECKRNGKEITDVEEIVEGSCFDSGTSKRKPDPEFFTVPDPEFYDFDKDRKEECFASDQLWAVYDTVDGMPRFYARTGKVFSPGFKVRITWLEPVPDSQDEIDWFNEDLPVSCGKFKHGSSEITEDINMFSHLVCEITGRRVSYKIYPKIGETWAIFKNWDMRWNSDPDNHRSYEFEFVEVLSDYSEGSPTRVAYLVKVKDFVSLFGLKKGSHSFQIPSNELYRFSHRIPSFKTTGTEREGLSEGYFELDPASLPDKIEELADLKDVEVVTESLHSKLNGFCPVSSDSVETSHTPNIVDEDYCEPLSPSSLDPFEIPDAEFYDFEADKRPEKFKPGQVWAIYCEFDGMPKYYGRITKIGPSPDFKLYITWLEPVEPPKDIIQWCEKEMPICCGMFKNGGTKVFDDIASFSHLSDAKSSGKNKYEIRPRKGEIWALYKNFSSEWTCSDLVKCEYDIVEVIENYVQVTKVMVLELVDGFDTVFKARGNVVSTLEIPQVELFRFSHKVPAFQLTAERDGRLNGFWELDPKSLPICLFRSS